MPQPTCASLACFHLGDRYKLNIMIDSFNLLNHENPMVQTSADGFQDAYGQWVFVDKYINFNYFPAYYQKTANPLKAFNAYAPRQVQLSLKLNY
jgi:hypothetical protein